MIFDLLTPYQSPRGRGQKKVKNLARPIHVSNSHTKFGLISSNGLGGDSITDRRTDRGDYNIPFAFLKKRGDNDKHLETSVFGINHLWISIDHLSISIIHLS